MSRLSLTLALVASCGLAGLAQAQDAKPDEANPTADPKASAVATLDALFPKGETVCFARTYDDGHLKRHPKQSVTSVRLMRGFQLVREDAAREPGLVYAELIVTYRKSGTRRFLGGANCRAQDDGTITCFSDSCDGGSFPMKREDADTVEIGGDAGASHFTVSGGCGDAGPEKSLTASDDDRFFRLTRAPMTDCR